MSHETRITPEEQPYIVPECPRCGGEIVQAALIEGVVAIHRVYKDGSTSESIYDVGNYWEADESEMAYCAECHTKVSPWSLSYWNEHYEGDENDDG